MESTFSEEKQALATNIEKTLNELDVLNAQVKDQEATLENLQQSGGQYHLLSEICRALDELDSLGASDLFWGKGKSATERENQIHNVHHVIADYQLQIKKVDTAKAELRNKVNDKIELLNDLECQLEEVIENEEQKKNEYKVEREEEERPFRPMLMPWRVQPQDQYRFYKSLGGVCVFLVLLNLLINFWELPIVTQEDIEVPEYLVEMVKKSKPKPQPPVQRPKPKEEKKEDVKVAKNKKQKKPEPTPEERKVAREKAQTAGVLAFKESFTKLLSDEVDERLGASANLRNNASSATGDSSRNLVMSQARQSSGGINSASISRGIGGTAGSQLGNGVSFSRVDSAIGTDMVADDRPLSDGVGPTRTDEEIQIVFDRYKAALYRIYNRELRSNPLLKGKMVLRITIEPDGSVSVAKVESTNMDSPSLASGVLARVQRFNFGPKEGVPVITILYPIDFLPAA